MPVASAQRLALEAALGQHRPVEVFFHVVAGDPHTEPVRAGAAAAPF